MFAFSIAGRYNRQNPEGGRKHQTMVTSSVLKSETRVLSTAILFAFLAAVCLSAPAMAQSSIKPTTVLKIPPGGLKPNPNLILPGDAADHTITGTITYPQGLGAFKNANTKQVYTVNVGTLHDSSKDPKTGGIVLPSYDPVPGVTVTLSPVYLKGNRYVATFTARNVPYDKPVHVAVQFSEYGKQHLSDAMNAGIQQFFTDSGSPNITLTSSKTSSSDLVLNIGVTILKWSSPNQGVVPKFRYHPLIRLASLLPRPRPPRPRFDDRSHGCHSGRRP